MTFRSRLRLPGGFDRDLSLLMCSMSSRRMAMGFMMIVRAIYFSLLGFSPVLIGVLMSIATLVSAVHHITFGILSDRFGRKLFLLLGGVFATLRMVIFALSTDFWMLALAQGIGAMGEGAGAGQPVVSGYIADKTDIRDRASVFSALAVANSLAATVGSLMAVLPAYFQNALGLDVFRAHSLLFWIGALGGFASMILILPIRDVRALKVNEQPAVERRASKEGSRDVILKFSLVRSTSGLGWGFIQSLESLYFFIRFGVGGEFLGPIYAAIRLLSVFSYALVPMVVERFGEISAIVYSRLATAAITIAFSITPILPLALILMAISRVFMMFTMPIRQSFATGIVDPEETATAIGVSSFARMGLRTIAPTVAGYMFESISFSMPFITGAALLAANGMLFRAFFQPKRE